jgi:dTMP kinase
VATRGRFITFEGIDGAGKSSHIQPLSVQLVAAGIRVVHTREPGGTPVGEQVRAIVLNQPMSPKCEALLMFAAREELLTQVIRPALAQGSWVIADRFTDATFAYQGGGRQLPESAIATLATWVHPDVTPDLTFVFDVPESVALERLQATRSSHDKFEREALAFVTRVRKAYLDRAHAEPGRIVVVDATAPIAEVFASVWTTMQHRYPELAL